MCPLRSKGLCPKTLSDQTQTAWLGDTVRLSVLSLHWERQRSVPLDHLGQAVAEKFSQWGEHQCIWEIFWFGVFRWYSLGSIFNTYLHVKMSTLFAGQGTWCRFTQWLYCLACCCCLLYSSINCSKFVSADGWVPAKEVHAFIFS